jgi:UDP-N-acetylglucosamine:LPS N-acetylglucosamine transferase
MMDTAPGTTSEERDAQVGAGEVPSIPPLRYMSHPSALVGRRPASDADHRPTVALISSIGGHIEELLSVSEAFADYRRVWLLEPSSRASALLEQGERVELLRPTSRNPLRANLPWNARAAVRVLRRHNPEVVVTTGAGIAAPFVVLSRLRGTKLIFIETVARIESPSASGRLLSPLAERTLVQWPDLAPAYRRAILCRPAVLESVAVRAQGGGEGTFVGLGTHVQPFDRLLRLVDDAVGAGILPPPVALQRGISDYSPRNFPAGVRFMPPTELARAIQAAQYVVCHAGAGIASAALKAGRRPLILARSREAGEHIDDHQQQLVRRLTDMGLAVELKDEISRTHLIAASKPLRDQMDAFAGEPLEAALRAELERLLGP